METSSGKSRLKSLFVLVCDFVSSSTVLFAAMVIVDAQKRNCGLDLPFYSAIGGGIAMTYFLWRLRRKD